MTNPTEHVKTLQEHVKTLQEHLKTLQEHLKQVSDEQIDAGGAALMLAFPSLAEDYTNDWFRKAAKVVLEAAKL